MAIIQGDQGSVGRFTIWCDAEHRYNYRVCIFKTRALMQTYIRHRDSHRFGKRIGRLKCEAMCSSWWKLVQSKTGRWERHRNIGEIVFHMGWCGAGIVSHEMTHASRYWLAYAHPRLFKQWQDSKRADEVQALAQGRLVNQFWNKFYKLGLAKDPTP